MTWSIIESDALTALRAMPDASFDSVVTDPPAGIKFMGAEWDGDKGGRDKWIAWLAEIFVEIRRVVKPGAHAIVWALPKTSHWTATAMENAGWRIIDVSVHLFGQGFPKSLNISKAIDKKAGAEREVVGPDPDGKRRNKNAPRFNGTDYANGHVEQGAPEVPVTAPATDDAKKWAGWGTALKPASEHWILARAPLSEKTIIGNVLAHGTGAINIDACRIGTTDFGALIDDIVSEVSREGEASADRRYPKDGRDFHPTPGPRGGGPLGRWPANVTIEHSSSCVLTGKKRVRTGVAVRRHVGKSGGNYGFGGANEDMRDDVSYADADGLEEIEDWSCAEECAVRLLDEQAGECPGMTGGGIHTIGYGGGIFGSIDSERTARGDSGGPSRFFYTAKPSRGEKEKGLDWMPARKVNDGRKAGGSGNDNPRLRGESDRKNFHSTVKPVALMRWLCKLVTPPGGRVLDPFAGSGTTLVAALADGFSCVGIEQDPEFVALAKARVEGDAPLLNRAKRW